MLQRSRSSNRSQPLARCDSQSKRKRTVAEGQQHGSDSYTTQDHTQIFELPPLALLISSIDHEDDTDDSLLYAFAACLVA